MAFEWVLVYADLGVYIGPFLSYKFPNKITLIRNPKIWNEEAEKSFKVEF